ncbi:MAG: GntR family transcriptional regulator [Anaerolineaceae bacterium]|nr:GntR family transcriptional regulator [Anaerolineaceae bacterium]
MLKAESSKPYYEQIKEYILYKIHAGELSPHSRVPSERILSEQFGVSRLTVSKAIKELVLEGKLYTQVGKGTFVSDEPIDQTLDALTSFSEDMEKRGQRPSSRVIEAGMVLSTEQIARRLQVPVGISLVMLKRVRLANDKPLALEAAYIVSDLCEGILNRFDFSRQSLYDVLQTHYHLRLTYADQELEARLATPEEAEILHLNPGSPVLSMTRVTYIETGQPVEYVESAYNGDHYKFRARLMGIERQKRGHDDKH